ncbi:Serine-threonine protein kinase 19 [Phytophthora cinnamomi]|uniref:Serine-threonine protein kinase 19 n=1 Tax=Phytophthora cinnamomi TaxID=4785 RepID=UPI003559C422|nr:Serine-threonine protein kinase 19 [Phytophthora cinnamomi]
MQRRHKRKRASVAAVSEDDEEWDASAELIDDTMASIQLLLNRNADSFAAIGLPPVVVWHQLYTILPNRTFVDQNVHRLRNEGNLVTFKIPSGAEDTSILRAEDYLAEVAKYQRVFRKQLLQHPEDEAISSKLSALTAFAQALPLLAPLSTVPLKALIAKVRETGSSADDQQIRAMVGRIQRLGFLLPTTRLDDEAYSFSIPGIGKLVSAIKKTRTQVLGTLKRMKYKEMHEQQLKKAKLKHSSFPLEFHLADMEGCGLIRRTKVTSGVLVAVANK